MAAMTTKIHRGPVPVRRLLSSADSTPEAPRHGVLVLLSFRHASHPYATWLGDLSCPLVGIACEAARPSAGFTHVSRVSTWEPSVLVERAVAIHRHHRFDRVIGLGEVDILPAAQIRERLKLPGQWAASARAYRDKLIMRQRARAGGMRVPPFAAVSCAQDVVRFVEKHGLPVMVKPRLGVGGVGIQQICSADGAATVACEPGRFLVEKFVEGSTFHVDALRVKGVLVLAVPCAYTGDGCMAHRHDRGIGSYTLAPSSRLFGRLISATRAVVEAFPGPPDLAIHAEFFASEKAIVLCEVASRGGGGGIPAMLTRHLGLDMRCLWTRIQCGLPVDWPCVKRQAALNPLVANFGLPPRNGRVRALPNRAPIDVEDLQFHVLPGEDFSGARYHGRHSGDLIATWVVVADTEANLIRTIESTAQAMERVILWDTRPSGQD
jgi:hypothetical protein